MAARGLRIWTTLALVVVGSCAAPPAAPPPAAAPPPVPQAAPAPPDTPPPAAPQTAQAAPPTPRPTDSCGAADLQYLIGRPRTDIPIPLTPGRRRVVCSTCPMTQDFVPYRQTIIYDAATGLVSSVKCG
jgi:hypothetical protein